MLSDIILSVNVLNVVMLSVIMLIVVAPFKSTPEMTEMNKKIVSAYFFTNKDQLRINRQKTLKK
jgi:hypothetical protein